MNDTVTGANEAAAVDSSKPAGEMVLAGRIEALRKHIQGLQIQDQNSYDAVAGKLRDVVTVKAEIEEYHKPIKSTHWVAHQKACAEEREMLDKVVKAEEWLKRLIGEWIEKKKKEQQEAERVALVKAQEESEAERKRQLQAARELAEKQIESMLEEATSFDEALVILGEKETAVSGAVEEARREPMPMLRVEVPQVMVPARGIGTKTEYVITVTNLRELVKAVAKGEVLITVLKADEGTIKKLAQAAKGKIEIPGVRVTEEVGVSARKR